MKKLLLLACTVSLFSCGKKDSDNPVPTIFSTWRKYSSKTIGVYFSTGVIVKKDSTIIYGKPKDSWIFTEDSKLTIYDEASNHTCSTTFTQKSDSILIQAGECSPNNFTAHVNLSVSGQLNLKYMSTTYYGSDSTQYITEVILLR
ncbi:hypothetical protein [Chitinophaga sp.]|uniref:hypothetical protein n=1 Tax=Chitinophaga sp. TaxID=1869181 RepID=UPI0031DC1334